MQVSPSNRAEVITKLLLVTHSQIHCKSHFVSGTNSAALFKNVNKSIEKKWNFYKAESHVLSGNIVGVPPYLCLDLTIDSPGTASNFRELSN